MARRVEFLEEVVAELAGRPGAVAGRPRPRRGALRRPRPSGRSTSSPPGPSPRSPGWSAGAAACCARAPSWSPSSARRALDGAARRWSPNWRPPGCGTSTRGLSVRALGDGCHYRGGHDAWSTVTAARPTGRPVAVPRGTGTATRLRSTWNTGRAGRTRDDRPGRAAAQQPRRRPVAATSSGMATSTAPSPWRRCARPGCCTRPTRIPSPPRGGSASSPSPTRRAASARRRPR